MKTDIYKQKNEKIITTVQHVLFSIFSTEIR